MEIVLTLPILGGEIFHLKIFTFFTSFTPSSSLLVCLDLPRPPQDCIFCPYFNLTHSWSVPTTRTFSPCIFAFFVFLLPFFWFLLLQTCPRISSQGLHHLYQPFLARDPPAHSRNTILPQSSEFLCHYITACDPIWALMSAPERASKIRCFELPSAQICVAGHDGGRKPKIKLGNYTSNITRKKFPHLLLLLKLALNNQLQQFVPWLPLCDSVNFRSFPFFVPSISHSFLDQSP